MKKISLLFLALIFALTLSACGNPMDDESGSRLMPSDGSSSNHASSNDESTMMPDMPTSGSSLFDEGYITRDEAIGIALKHAGLKREDITDLEAELDSDSGIAEWDIDFDKDNFDYSYDINASTGKIIRSEKDLND